MKDAEHTAGKMLGGFLKTLVAVGAFAAALPLMADTEKVGDHTWTYKISGDTAEITGVSPSTGAMTIPATLGGKPVTSIGYAAFHNCSGLTAVTIPDSVTHIGDYAFEYCTGLACLTMGNGVTDIGYGAFAGCSGLTDMMLPSSVTNIDEYAFSGCVELRSVTIPSSVTSIGDYAFEACFRLEHAVLPESFKDAANINKILQSCQVYVNNEVNYRNVNVEVVDGIAWAYTLIGSSPVYAKVGGGAYGWAISTNTVGDIVIPLRLGGLAVVSIGDWAFYKCVGLTGVTMPHYVSDVGHGAFVGCSGLASIMIPSGATHIDEYAFADCGGLESVTMPSGMLSIGDHAFMGCTKLVHALLPERFKTASNIGEIFEGCPVYSNKEVEYRGVNVQFIDGIYWVFPVTPVGNDVAVGGGANGLAISEYTTGNIAIPSMQFNDPVSSIMDYAFMNCAGLTGVTIPDSVTNIGDKAFCGCTAITDVYCHADPAVLTWGDASKDFKSGKQTKIHVETSQFSAYVSKFGSMVNATFVGDLPDTFKLTFDSNGGVLVGENFGSMNGRSGVATVTVAYGKGSYSAGMRAWDFGDEISQKGAAFEGWWTATSGGTPQYDADGKCIPGEGCWSSAGLWNLHSDVKL